MSVGKINRFMGCRNEIPVEVVLYMEAMLVKLTRIRKASSRIRNCTKPRKLRSAEKESQYY